MSIVKINALTIPEGHGEDLEKRFEARKHVVDNAPGFEGFQLLRPVKGETRYFVVTQWADEASYQAWRDSDERKGNKDDTAAHDGSRKPVAKSFELLEFEVVLGSKPEHA
ncbi:antibiotic biosynthesis monooxygenase family protein [Corynebacterium freiburgense]|uniref:antibiotic biosynthesis monooxygenase family protein n=1 Tax=Corynebacterium freiburgense TaxID=556548 RepID=UPI000426F658|nr:antibiotic biosynthesis monooxygenase [Corynebacterium freiburgense]WJZ03937.1 Heme-degrading monooxygenase HmoB [Corynebacterium freiburgense]